jgi:hypothetical protein
MEMKCQFIASVNREHSNRKQTQKSSVAETANTAGGKQ